MKTKNTEHSFSVKFISYRPFCDKKLEIHTTILNHDVKIKNLFKIMGLYQGNPATVFCKISVRRRKNYLTLSIA